jgi:hypothetical protein
MAPTRKTRTLRLLDGGLFRIGPGTTTVHVSTVPLDPPAVLLHVNRSCGCLELEPLADGTTPQPVRVNPARVLEIVERINADRAMAAMRGGKAEPPVELPPTFKTTARHVAVWQQQALPFVTVADEAAGYPSKTDGNTTLWVKRATGACVLERVLPPSNPKDRVGTVAWQEMTPRQAVDWLEAHGYRAIPATLHRLARTGKGATDEPPKRKRR